MNKNQRTKRPRSFVLFLLFLFFASIPKVQAYVHTLPESLVHDVLSESIAEAFPPNDFSLEDFTVEWLGAPIEGIRFEFTPRSLQWVRVGEFFVFPRARLNIEAENLESGRISYSTFNHTFFVDKEKKGHSNLSVALVSGTRNSLDISIQRNGTLITGRARIHFKPRDVHPKPFIYYDSSCSQYNVQAESFGAKSDEWMYVSCRLVITKTLNYAAAILELYVYWDNVGDEIEIEGVKTASIRPSIWVLRQQPKPGHVTLKAGAHAAKISYSIPDPYHSLWLSAGIGPYFYAFAGGGSNTNTIAPILTLYGSYLLTERFRFVMFNATALNRSYYSDTGIYLPSGSVKLLDDRVSVNLFLGGHFIFFRAEDQTIFRYGFPQGVEVIFRDFILRSYNTTVGGFIFPGGNSYYNLWLRWGTRNYFGEINYIIWEERGIHDRIFSRSLGITLGFPLGRFL